MESVGWVWCVVGGFAELNGSGRSADPGCLNSMRRAMLKQVQIKPVNSNALRGILISATAGYDGRIK